MKVKKISILYVDDEENNLIAFKATFRRKYDIKTAINAEEAIALLNQYPFEVIITDQRMPKITGVEFLEQIIPTHPEATRILLTGYTDMSAVVDAINKGKIFHYLNKPWNEEELESTIEKAFQAYLEKQKLKEMNEQLMLTNEQLEFLVRQKLLS